MKRSWVSGVKSEWKDQKGPYSVVRISHMPSEGILGRRVVANKEDHQDRTCNPADIDLPVRS